MEESESVSYGRPSSSLSQVSSNGRLSSSSSPKPPSSLPLTPHHLHTVDCSTQTPVSPSRPPSPLITYVNKSFPFHLPPFLRRSLTSRDVSHSNGPAVTNPASSLPTPSSPTSSAPHNHHLNNNNNNPHHHHHLFYHVLHPSQPGPASEGGGSSHSGGGLNMKHCLMAGSAPSPSEHRKSPLVTGPMTPGNLDDINLSERSAIYSYPSIVPVTASSSSSRNKLKPRRRKSEWEILEGLKDGQKHEQVPDRYEGLMLKRRKWPLKGWHKRWFCIDRGILTYTKTAGDMAKGKVHGSVDVGLSVISTKLSSKRIDIDAEEFIYHIKCKNKSQFSQWVTQLRVHRLYRQHEISFGNMDPLTNSSSAADDRERRILGNDPSDPHSKVRSWMYDSHAALDEVARELAEYHGKLVDLSAILQIIENISSASAGGKPSSDSDAGGAKNTAGKYKRRFLLRRHKKTPAPTPNAPSTSPNILIIDTGHSPHMPHVKSDTALSSHDVHGMGGMMTSSYAGGAGAGDQLALDPKQSSSSSMTHSMSIQGSGLLGESVAMSIHGNDLVIPSTKPLEEFLTIASEVRAGLRSSLRRMQIEWDKVRKRPSTSGGSGIPTVASAIAVAAAALESSASPPGGDSSMGSNQVIRNLQLSLQAMLKENAELKCKLERIHEESDTSYLDPVPHMSALLLGSSGKGSSPRKGVRTISLKRRSSLNNNNNQVGDSKKMPHDEGADEEELTEEEDEEDEDNNSQNTTLVHQPIGHSKSYQSSSILSISEYFDAEDRMSPSSTSTEDEDDESFATDASEDDGVDTANAQELKLIDTKGALGSPAGTGRRSKLPTPCPDLGDVSLWSLLCKNIGKDLSKISMPVTINEPLNMLQRLCEELEYCELLDKAASIDDPKERILYVAAFSVSAYGSATYRAGHKPFNPLLGETYECIREDKGFRFVSEQVSHHPPISACHAESDNYVFWQDMRIKTKFWGKSMEIIPFGTVHVMLKPSGSHYTWNKVTTCVHNIIKGQRWVDQYGEMIITDETDGLKCTLTFVKASYWSNKKHEVCGTVTNLKGDVLEHIFGKWDEALYAGKAAPSARCIWRPGAMSSDNQLYYGFSRFAIELNELTDDLLPLLPPTDTRFRPDQRLLEEGDIDGAEAEKTRLEQIQRERRRDREDAGQDHRALWFNRTQNNGDEIWTFSDRYWKDRNEGKFKDMQFSDLWTKE